MSDGGRGSGRGASTRGLPRKATIASLSPWYDAVSGGVPCEGHRHTSVIVLTVLNLSREIARPITTLICRCGFATGLSVCGRLRSTTVAVP
jgi:hypothetical protein